MNITKYRSQKRTKKVIGDLKAVLNILESVNRGLEHFESYVPVQEVLSAVKDSEKRIQTHLEKLTKSLHEG